MQTVLLFTLPAGVHANSYALCMEGGRKVTPEGNTQVLWCLYIGFGLAKFRASVNSMDIDNGIIFYRRTPQYMWLNALI